MKQSEKLSTTATTMASRMKTGAEPSAIEKPTTTLVDIAQVEGIIGEWPEMAAKSARQTTEKYGPPNEATPSHLVWFNNGPWKRTIVHRHEIPHDFPQPHTDVIENVISYKVPVDRLTELGRYDGSLYVDRTRGEASARCDMENANILSLNLMHDIIQGRYTAEQAREKYAEVTADFMLNRPPPYAEALQFTPPTEDTRFTDESKIGAAMLKQAGEKIKDAFRGENPS
ncbi:hypothetical protein ABID22_002179 [Pontibacter aydingkolensis]|uniref:Uncharacterized protein n=1 Tax=Pontibacter aydingkolensis TaxID=1911536 RepID=A0ABS7CV98_9BACT|nr:hypothetical protein [Pontibacter aydingkolensis]MBW7467789.1 hypothetical protein [Pontibacter aydingkolensis]